MTVGEMIDRIVAFKRGEGEGRFLSEVDPECASTLSVYWDAFGPHGAKPSKESINFLFSEVERKMAEVPA